MNTTPKTLEHWHNTSDECDYPAACHSEAQPKNPDCLDATVGPFASAQGDMPYWKSSAVLTDSCNKHAWLIRTGLMPLVDEMMRLSRAYDFPWAASWRYHMDNPDWLSRAMAQTFMLITAEEKETVREWYDDWLWYQKNLDMQKMVDPEFNALCYLLDRKGKRLSNENGEVTVLRGLKGQNKQEALATLDTRCYEFKAWW